MTVVVSPTPEHERCQHLPVAQSNSGNISVCLHCRQVHLGLQYMTLRFETDAFRELAMLVSFAQRRLDGDPSLAPDNAPAGSDQPADRLH